MLLPPAFTTASKRAGYDLRRALKSSVSYSNFCNSSPRAISRECPVAMRLSLTLFFKTDPKCSHEFRSVEEPGYSEFQKSQYCWKALDVHCIKAGKSVKMGNILIRTHTTFQVEWAIVKRQLNIII